MIIKAVTMVALIIGLWMFTDPHGFCEVLEYFGVPINWDE